MDNVNSCVDNIDNIDNIGDHIFSNELILSKVFCSLPLFELLRKCNVISRQWHCVVRRVIAHRTSVDHMFQLFRIGRHHNTNPNTNNANNGNSGGNAETHLIASNGSDLSFISDNFDAFQRECDHKLTQQLYCLPHFVIIFYGSFCPHSRRPEQLLRLRKHLTPNCKILNAISCSGVIGCPSSGNPSQPMPTETQSGVGNCAGISLIVFPNIANLEIDVFDDRNLITLEKLKSRNDLKCILLFCTNCTDGKHQYKEFRSINTLMEKYDNKLAIGGVVIDDINFFENNNNNTKKKTRDFFAIAFSGLNVKACSLVLRTDQPDITEAKLTQFRNNIGFDPYCAFTQTIAFIFICAGRGIHTYGKPNVESMLFHKVFPNIKLFGVYGQGEYGHDYWPQITSNNRPLQSQQQTDHQFWQFYTTILVLINIPNK